MIKVFETDTNNIVGVANNNNKTNFTNISTKLYE